ncbi:MAG: hypothetical protein F6J98_17105 [Moorea sp. SIO4G2]|nr:hypothetical protein [Moorena sp. SIO4G2]
MYSCEIFSISSSLTGGSGEMVWSDDKGRWLHRFYDTVYLNSSPRFPIPDSRFPIPDN